VGAGGDCGSGEAAERKLRLKLALVRGVVLACPAQWSGSRVAAAQMSSRSGGAAAAVQIHPRRRIPSPNITGTGEDRSTALDPDLELTPTRIVAAHKLRMNKYVVYCHGYQAHHHSLF